MNSTETETPQITTDADIESYQLTATAANTLDIAHSTLCFFVFKLRWRQGTVV